MAEAFGVAAAALGLAASAVDSILKLKKLIDNLADAPGAIENIKSNLNTIGPPLKSLADLSKDDHTAALVKTELNKAGVNAAVESCGKASEEFQNKLAKWTKHSTADHMHWWDRFKTGAWELEAINTFVQRIEFLKQTVSMAVATTILLIQAEVLKRSEASTVSRDQTQLALQQQAESVNAKLDGIKKLLEERKEHSAALTKVVVAAADEDNEVEELRAIKCKDQVDEEVKVIEQQAVNCLAVLKRIQSARSSLSIGAVKTDEYSQAIVGIPEHLLEKVDVQIGDVNTTNHSKAVVGGYSSNLDMNEFFKNPPKPPE